MISCVILAAGLSSRFGSPKPLASIQGTTVIEYLQNILINTKLREIIIVLGAYAEQIKPHILNHRKISIVYNKDYNLGQTSSIKAGLLSVSKDSPGVMLLPVDYPAMRKETIDQLIDVFLTQRQFILIPTYQGKKGHPPIFPEKLIEMILRMDNSCGVNTLARQNTVEVKYFEVNDPRILYSFNSPKELKGITACLD